jgi:hypothetical protein
MLLVDQPTCYHVVVHMFVAPVSPTNIFPYR